MEIANMMIIYNIDMIILITQVQLARNLTCTSKLLIPGAQLAPAIIKEIKVSIRMYCTIEK